MNTTISMYCTHHEPGFTNGWLGVRDAQEDGHPALDLVDVGHTWAVELGDPGPVVEVDQEPVDPAVVGVDGHVPSQVLAPGPAFTLKVFYSTKLLSS